jgi:fatty acid desaturase
MLKKIRKIDEEMKSNLFHYSALVVMMNILIGAYLFLGFNRTYQMIIVLTAGIAYVFWGIIHHHLNDDLHLKVLAEYVLVALLAELIIFSLILRA